MIGISVLSDDKHPSRSEKFISELLYRIEFKDILISIVSSKRVELNDNRLNIIPRESCVTEGCAHNINCLYFRDQGITKVVLINAYFQFSENGFSQLLSYFSSSNLNYLVPIDESCKVFSQSNYSFSLTKSSGNTFLPILGVDLEEYLFFEGCDERLSGEFMQRDLRHKISRIIPVSLRKDILLDINCDNVDSIWVSPKMRLLNHINRIYEWRK